MTHEVLSFLIDNDKSEMLSSTHMLGLAILNLMVVQGGHLEGSVPPDEESSPILKRLLQLEIHEKVKE